MNLTLDTKLTPEGRALKWVGAWSRRMTDAGLRFDPSTRRIDRADAERFVLTVMQRGFMRDDYVPKVLAPQENAAVHAMVVELVKAGVPFTFRAGQRAFDQISSFDLRSMVNQYFQPNMTTERLRRTPLDDPEMGLFHNMPAVSVIGAQSFPTFRLEPIDDKNRIIYKAPGFMRGSIETTRDDVYEDHHGVGIMRRPGGEVVTIDQRYSVNRIFAEHGLFGYKVEMDDFDPRTALGGMGMSNLAVFMAIIMAGILSKSGKDIGQLFAEAAYVENSRLNGLTGFQEMIQALFNGSGILVYAHGYYGGIGRQLLAPGHAHQVEEQMKLILFNRIAGDRRLPVNETWTLQAVQPEYELVYRAVLENAWKRETFPFLQASATGSPIDMDAVREGYMLHAWQRYVACQQYFGNEGEREFIMAMREKSVAVFPLGEGSNNSAKLAIGLSAEDLEKLPVLTRDQAAAALNIHSTVTTGQIPFKMLDRNFELGPGFLHVHNGHALPAPLITIIGG